MRQILFLCTRLSFGLALFFSISSCNASKEIAGSEPSHKTEFAFNFMESPSLSIVLDQAKKENKLVFVDLYASWCLPCKLMDRDVFTDEPTANFMNDRFISYKVDAEKANGPDLAVIFEVKGYPTLLFLDTRGRVLKKKTGAVYPREFLSLAQEAMNQSQLGE